MADTNVPLGDSSGAAEAHRMRRRGASYSPLYLPAAQINVDHAHPKTHHQFEGKKSIWARAPRLYPA